MTITTQNCPDLGAWRAWLDHEGDLADAEAHVRTCPACRQLVQELNQDATVARESLAALAPAHTPNSAEVAVARERVARRRSASPTRTPAARVASRPQLESVPMFFTRVSTPWRVAGGGLAAALVLAVVVAFTPQGSAAASGFLAQFRSQQVQAIEITPQSQADIVRSLSGLNNLGTLKMPSAATAGSPAAVARTEAQQSHTATPSEAAQTVGFKLLTPDPAMLPASVSQTPTIKVTPASEVRFTFDKNKARTYYQSTGHPEVSLPDKFDGASLIVSLPPAAVLSYSGASNTRDEVIVAEAGELVVDTQGNVSLTEMRDFLLGLPGLPPAVVSQLRTIQNWNNTLPIPVPVDQMQWETTKVNGADGLLLNDNSGIGSAEIWHSGGHLMGVAGTLKASDLKKVAESMAVR